MFDLGWLISLDCALVEAQARSEGRTPTQEEYRAAIQKTWNAWLEVAVTRDMIRAGFVKTETGWTKPRRGLLARLFGGSVT